ncbi:MAG: [LysW]-aminoadipate kinase [Candidatus Bipolaricaulia bacterium]
MSVQLLVVKIGGSEGIDYDAFLDNLADYQRFILVHGGSHELNRISEILGAPPRFVTSVSGFTSRYTDRETLEILNMVYAGKMNKRLVEGLQRRGVNAVGLSGLDGRIWEGKRKSTLKIVEGGRKRVLRGDHSGIIERVNTELLDWLLEHSYVPVLTPPAISYEGVAVNVDGDRAAAQVAAAMGAERLVILSNVPGLLKDVNDEDSLIDRIAPDEVDAYLERYAKGRMKKKLLGAKEALAGGVSTVILGDARGERPITQALDGVGTVIGSLQ